MFSPVWLQKPAVLFNSRSEKLDWPWGDYEAAKIFFDCNKATITTYPIINIPDLEVNGEHFVVLDGCIATIEDLSVKRNHPNYHYQINPFVGNITEYSVKFWGPRRSWHDFDDEAVDFSRICKPYSKKEGFQTISDAKVFVQQVADGFFGFENASQF